MEQTGTSRLAYLESDVSGGLSPPLTHVVKLLAQAMISTLNVNSPMWRIRVTAIAALVLAALGTVLWIALSPREHEPVYQGKTLTYWLSDFWPGRNPTRERVEQDKLAVRQIGTNAIPILLQWISAKDGPLKQKTVMWIDRHRRVPFRLESSVDKNMLAVSGFWILGKTQAGSAIPALLEIIRNGGGERTSSLNNVTFPMLALADLDPEAAAKAGIQFGTNGTVAGWGPPPAATNN